MMHTLFMIEISVRRITIYTNGSLLALFLIQKNISQRREK